MDREEALGILRRNIPDEGSNSPLRTALETLVPELTESPDQKIIKTLKVCLALDTSKFLFERKDVPIEDAVALVERCGKSGWKPTERQIWALESVIDYAYASHRELLRVLLANLRNL